MEDSLEDSEVAEAEERFQKAISKTEIDVDIFRYRDLFTVTKNTADVHGACSWDVEVATSRCYGENGFGNLQVDGALLDGGAFEGIKKKNIYDAKVVKRRLNIMKRLGMSRRFEQRHSKNLVADETAPALHQSTEKGGEIGGNVKTTRNKDCVVDSKMLAVAEHNSIIY